jgi:hypothetical protein
VKKGIEKETKVIDGIKVTYCTSGKERYVYATCPQCLIGTHHIEIHKGDMGGYAASLITKHILKNHSSSTS